MVLKKIFHAFVALTVGVTGVLTVVVACTTAAEAQVALLDAERRTEPAVVGYNDLALSDLILSQSPPELAARAESILDPLKCQRPEMFETLVAYLEHDCDVIACAKAMFVHPNTLRYRLSRIEATLGRSLRSVSTIADLYLALRLQVPRR